MKSWASDERDQLVFVGVWTEDYHVIARWLPVYHCMRRSSRSVLFNCFVASWWFCVPPSTVLQHARRGVSYSSTLLMIGSLCSANYPGVLDLSGDTQLVAFWP